MTFKILVTGGAGFIGSHLVDTLVKDGHDIVVLDNLEPQVHHSKPDYLNPNARYVFDDVRNIQALKSALEDVEIVFHEAALVGIGQSMYHIKRYVDANSVGTANLLDVIVNGNFGIKKIIVASSMSIYGEGAYLCENCGSAFPVLRPKEQLEKREWEFKCRCGRTLKPSPTTENKLLNPTSIYAITKKDQEDMFITVGKAYGIPAVALRYFNVYGTRQSLNNPYTGVCAIFSSQIKNNNQPFIFEDGMQSRDFVSVHDIARANILAMNNSKANYETFNVGTGEKTTILEIARLLAKLYGKNLMPKITSKFREGDIRHCYADITKIRRVGFEPAVNLEDGLKELVEWGMRTEARDNTKYAYKELEERGLSG